VSLGNPSVFSFFLYFYLYLAPFDSLSLLHLKKSAGGGGSIFWNPQQPNVACHSEGGIRDQIPLWC